MASDQHMIEVLSNMLQKGETLMCPIFGYVRVSRFQQFAYFGLTETHFLIAYLSGEQVTDTVRIPLNINAIKIKKSKLLNEYTIDILFEKGKAYTICAFPKVLKVKAQEENFSPFLKLLKSKAKADTRSLEEIEGQKIRWQYFNTYIFIMLAVIPAVPAMIIMGELRKGNFDIWKTIVEMSEAIPAIAALYAVLIGPFIVLSIFNRFSFGKIIGIVREGILHLENREIPIRDIAEITYHPRVISRRKINYSYATFAVRLNEGMESFDVLHFPMYGLREIIKCNKEIKVKRDKYIWFLLLCPTVIFAIIGFLLS